MYASNDRNPIAGSTAVANNASKGISVPAPVQRKIKFGVTKMYGKGAREINDIETLQSAVAEIFPRFKPAFIAEQIKEIVNDEETWSLANVYTHFSRLHKNLPPKDITQEFNGDIRLPEKPNDRKNYLFTTRTRLNAKVKVGEKDYYTPEYTQTDKEHAEEQLKRYLEELITRKDGKVDIASGKLIITINNSPCFKRCSGILITFKQETWKGEMIIYYANPHGNIDDEFHVRRKQMFAAGITLHSFNPLAYIDRSIIGEDDEKRFRDASTRRKRARKLWRKEHPSNASDNSDSEHDSSDDDLKPERKKPKLKVKQTSPPPSPIVSEEEGEADYSSSPSHSDYSFSQSERSDNEEEEEVPKEEMHESVMSEAQRIGIDKHYTIGFADGTDHNCSILAMFASAGSPLNKEEGIRLRETLVQKYGIPEEGDIDIENKQAANQILQEVTAATGHGYTLYAVQEIDYGHEAVEITRTGDGAQKIYVFFAGTHFSPAWPKKKD